MFTAAWYFLKLSAFFDSLQPLFLALFIPREVWEDKGTILLFSNLVQRGQLSKGQRDSGDYLDCFDQKLQTDRHGMGQRGWTCRQDSCTLEMDASSRYVEVWVSPIDQLADWHSASPATMQKGWAGIHLRLKKPLLAILDEQRKWPTCCCLLLLEEAALPSPEGNGSWNHWCCTRGRIQHPSLSQMCWEVCLIS